MPDREGTQMVSTKWNFEAEYIQSCNCDYGCPCNFNGYPSKGHCEALVGYRIGNGSVDGTKLDGVKFSLGLWWPKAIHEGNGSARIYIDPSASPAQKKVVEELCSGKHGGGAFEIFPKTFSKVFPTKATKIDWSFKGYDSRFAVDGVGEVVSSHIRNAVTNDPFEGQVMLPGGIQFKKAEVTSVDWWLRDSEATWNMSHRKTNGHVAKVTFTEKGPA
jgi:hypothetical protein